MASFPFLWKIRNLIVELLLYDLTLKNITIIILLLIVSLIRAIQSSLVGYQRKVSSTTLTTIMPTLLP